jgi:beta-N-acetylhexosaminidase
VQDAEQVAKLTRGLAERSFACTGRPLLIAMDAEGGRVMRLSPRAGYPETLSHKDLGDDNDFTETELEARRIGGMLRAAGVNWNLAPVVDVGYNPANPVIVGLARSFSANPQLVTAHARAYVRGMREARVLTALKHFPGHGSSYGDTHRGFVDVTATANPDVELVPYRALIAERLADSIMTAHVFNERLDRRWPATLSRPTVTGLLRREVGWAGVVVSDDLRMGAIEQHYGLGDATVRAMRAGVDVLLIAEDRMSDGRSGAGIALDALRRAIRRGHVPVGRVEDALAHVAELKSKIPPPR